MKEKAEEIKKRLAGIASVYHTGFSMKERRPNGVYRTNKAFTGAAGNAIGLKVVDNKVDGTLYLSVRYELASRDRVENLVNSLVNPEWQKTLQERIDTSYLEAQVRNLQSDAELVKRVRRGPVVTGSSYPLGLHVIRALPYGIEAVVADDHAHMPVFIEPLRGREAELGRKYMDYSMRMT